MRDQIHSNSEITTSMRITLRPRLKFLTPQLDNHLQIS